ncbi:MAG: hypothetical protein H0U74_01835 [Bradymonadaceae bacterium]|nr:hypothetical protein [Lujinxingiaceae bacterium]
MSSTDPQLVLTTLVALLVPASVAFLLAKSYRKVDQGQALVINTLKDVKVAFSGAFVLPVFHRAELMDISVKTITIDRHGKNGLSCKDNIRADLRLTFFVCVNPSAENVLLVARSLGCARASDPGTLEELFASKFTEALKTCAKGLDFEQLYAHREEFIDDVIQTIGDELNGFLLEDAVIDHLEQTPLAELDPDNILDARGIRKITELTAEQHMPANDLSNAAKRYIASNDRDTAAAVMELEGQQAEARAHQARDLAAFKQEISDQLAPEPVEAAVATIPNASGE